MIQPSLKRPKGRMALNYFTPSKNQRDTVSAKVVEPRLNGGAGNSPEILSTFGTGMTITGNIVCAGALQVFGRVIGEIQASHLVICEGAKVEGKIVAQETVIEGAFTARSTPTASNCRAGPRSTARFSTSRW